MRFHVKNRTSELRRFAVGDRYLTLAGGESERNIELSKDEANALTATNEFYVTEIKEAAAEPKAVPVRQAAEDRPSKAT